MRRLVSLLTLCLAFPSFAADYLPEDLRSRVEQLKRTGAATPSNVTNARARARTLWQWVNAHARSGRYVPVNTTQLLARVMAADAPNLAQLRQLDLSIAEFVLLDEEPEALGQLTTPAGPLVAGTRATIRQTYRVGTRTIQTGGGFVVAKHFMAPFGSWQTEDPDSPGYINIASDNPNVNFVTASRPILGMHGGFRGAAPALMFQLTSGRLREGDEVTITYGGGTGENIGVTVPTFSSERMPLPLYLAFYDDSPLFSLPIQPLRVIGQGIAGVRGFAPSVVAPEEPFTLTVRAEDRFVNRAVGAIPDWQIFLNDELWLELPATGAITQTEVSIDQPDVYYLSIRSSDGAYVGEVNPILVTVQDRPRVYWGDTHGHSGFAEGVGTAEQFMHWARDDARLDFVTHSEHDIWLDDFEWQHLQDVVRDFSKDGEFIAYLGYEWTIPNPNGGHHNVLFRTPDNRKRIPAQFYSTLSSLYQGLRTHHASEDVVVIPHAHNSGDFRLSDPDLQPLVEIMSQHGNFEWFGRMYLKQGHQVGFTAASDNHLSQPGYSAPLGTSLAQRGGLGAVLASERTGDAIFDAMRNLRSYATTGDRIILDFSLNDTQMGQRAPFAAQRNIRGRVIGTAPIDNITVFKNDEILWQRDYRSASFAKLPNEITLQLSFISEAEPYSPRDNPRGWRWWQGNIDVDNGRLLAINPLDNKLPGQRAALQEDGTATFRTGTRGAASSYLLRVGNVGRNTRIAVQLEPTRETGAAPPMYRPPQNIPGASLELALSAMSEGKLSATSGVDSYIDSITLRAINTAGERVVAFELDDEDQRHGDYYFVRVTQANDAIAWSSPIWVGGSAPR
ncbi:MAG: DUF3604 domain-containing protein [Pseudomonadota bacterium]